MPAPTSSPSFLRRFLGPAVVIAALGAAALIFRGRLVAWFSGADFDTGPTSPGARVTAGDLAIVTSLSPDPPRISGNRVQVEVRDAAGAPLDGATVTVTYNMPAMGAMAEMKGSATAAAEGAGVYRSALDLPGGGSYSLEVEVASATGTATARYNLTVGNPGLAVVDGKGSRPAAPPKPAAVAPVIARYALPVAALAALTRTFEGYERIRGALAHDRFADLAPAAKEVGAALGDADRALARAPDEVRARIRARRRAPSPRSASRARSTTVGRRSATSAARCRRSRSPIRGSPRAGTPSSARWRPATRAGSSAARARESLHGARSPTCGGASTWEGPAATEAAAAAPVDDSDDVITVDPARREVLGIGTSPVVRAPMALAVRAVGRLTFDETQLKDVTTRVSGYITKLRVSATGQAVQKGDTLFTYYSPDLFAAQHEALFAWKRATTATGATGDPHADPLLHAAETKLRLWGFGDAQLKALYARGEPLEDIPFPSPASGVVIEKDVVEGDAIQAGMRLYRIAALDVVWVEADVYEADLARITKGQRATISLTYLPGETFEGKVAFIYPYLDPASRTGRVRVELPNRGLELKPDMYATVAFDAVALGPRLQVPVSAGGQHRSAAPSCSSISARAAVPQEVTIGARSRRHRRGPDRGSGTSAVVVTRGQLPGRRREPHPLGEHYWEDEPMARPAHEPGKDRGARRDRHDHRRERAQPADRDPPRRGPRRVGLDVAPARAARRDSGPVRRPGHRLHRVDGAQPDLVEDQLTYPISSSLVAVPGVSSVRGQSMFGMSFVYVIFEDGTDIYWARSRVLEYLNQVRSRLPEGVAPTLGPDATGVGWVFEYALVDPTGKHDLQELRSLQDWNLRYALQGVPGVAEVATVGGYTKQYQVDARPDEARGATASASPEVMMAIERSNHDVGGQVIEIAGHEHVIRGRGYVRSDRGPREHPAEGRARPACRSWSATSATSAIGPDIRRGVAELDGEGEVVGGIVVMRYGQNALDVIDGVKARLDELRATLPAGVQIVPTYDRSELIRASIATLRGTLVEEMIVVSVIIFLFLLHVRSALIPILTLPLGVLLAFIPMASQDLTANIMSLGGIAVAMGAMVDASIIIIENIHKRLEDWDRDGRCTDRREAIIAAMQEVGPSIFFSLLVITVAFIPVFTLEGVEGRLFKPLAFTKTYSMGFAAILAITLTPALAAILVRGTILREDRHPLNRVLVAGYAPVVRFVVAHRHAVLVGAALVIAFTVPAMFRLGSEFMPPLNEGTMLYMPSAPPGMSIAEAARVTAIMDRELHAIPEVLTVFGKNGRAETATDPAPLGMVETVIVLKPEDQWRPGLTFTALKQEIEQKLQYPGMPNLLWMPIQTRTEMLSTGVRAPIAVQVYGDDADQIEQAAVAIERALADAPGTQSAFADRSTGGFYIDLVVKRDAAARFGLTVADIDEVIETAIGGMDAGETVEGRARYPINIRYAREFRDDPQLLDRVLVPTPTGAQIPLSQVVEMRTVTGPPMIRSEGGKLVGFVFVDTNRPLADYVDDAKEIVARQAVLPPGVRIAWVGQFQYLERAKAKLVIVVPITLLIVFLLLYLNTRSLVETGIVLLAVPFSLVGAIWLLYLLDYNVSVAVWVGMIALAGLDAETGVVMLLYLTIAHRRSHEAGRLRTRGDLREAIVLGAAHRIRPKLMTVLTMMIGLIPVLWSTGAGADVMKRIAAPMVGGLVTSFVLELLVYPAVFAIWKGRGLPEGEPTPASEGAQPPRS